MFRALNPRTRVMRIPFSADRLMPTIISLSLGTDTVARQGGGRFRFRFLLPVRVATVQANLAILFRLLFFFSFFLFFVKTLSPLHSTCLYVRVGLSRILSGGDAERYIV